MPLIRTTNPSSKPSQPDSKARPSGNAIRILRDPWPSPPGSSHASAVGPATTASQVPKSCASASPTSTPTNTELPLPSQMGESDSRLRGEVGDGAQRSLRVRGTIRESEPVEGPPHPLPRCSGPLPANGGGRKKQT